MCQSKRHIFMRIIHFPPKVGTNREEISKLVKSTKIGSFANSLIGVEYTKKKANREKKTHTSHTFEQEHTETILMKAERCLWTWKRVTKKKTRIVSKAIVIGALFRSSVACILCVTFMTCRHRVHVLVSSHSKCNVRIVANLPKWITW